MKYSRHELVLGRKAQEKLMASKAAVVGIGALGSIAAELLARAGVNLFIIDKDVVSLSDLHRQLLYDEKDVGLKKVDVAVKNLSINTLPYFNFD